MTATEFLTSWRTGENLHRLLVSRNPVIVTPSGTEFTNIALSIQSSATETLTVEDIDGTSMAISVTANVSIVGPFKKFTAQSGAGQVIIHV